MNSVKQINTAFRRYAKEHQIPIRRGLPQNSQPAYTRMAYVSFIDSLARGGQISENLAYKATYF